MKIKKSLLSIFMCTICILSFAGCTSAKGYISSADNSLIEIMNNDYFTSGSINGFSSDCFINYNNSHLTEFINSSTTSNVSEVTSLYNCIISHAITYSREVINQLILKVNNDENVDKNVAENLYNKINNLKTKLSNLPTAVQEFEMFISNSYNNTTIVTSSVYQFKINIKNIIVCAEELLEYCANVTERMFEDYADDLLIRNYLISKEIKILYSTALQTEFIENFEYLANERNCEFLSTYDKIKSNFISSYKAIMQKSSLSMENIEIFKIYETNFNLFAQNYKNFAPSNLKKFDYNLTNYLNSDTNISSYYNNVYDFIYTIYPNYASQI